jgi:hypothetical protein
MIYRYALDCEVAEDILELSSKQRSRFIQIFRQLADDPFQTGEQIFKDFAGRDIQKKKFDRWLISFWADHAGKEVRIVGLQRVKS